MSDFISCCRTQIKLVIMPPHNVKIRTVIFIPVLKGGIKYIIRSIPYPPSFKRTAARIIDPATGASTCALGSHRCTMNKGSFTIKARFIINQNGPEVELNLNKEKNILSILSQIAWIAIPPKRGNLAVMVYNIKYILAWRRSGWYPHFIIIKSVGIKDASNII